jgi:hypothetical protein
MEVKVDALQAFADFPLNLKSACIGARRYVFNLWRVFSLCVAGSQNKFSSGGGGECVKSYSWRQYPTALQQES